MNEIQLNEYVRGANRPPGPTWSERIRATLDVPTNQVIRLKIWVNWRSVNSKIASCGFGIGLKVEFITAIWTYGLHIRSEARWANSQLKYNLNLT